MPVEIERKFLVIGETWRDAAIGPALRMRQGYIATGGDGMTVRVRLEGDRGVLTLKGPGLKTRAEFEYAIPAADAEALLAEHCAGPLIEKQRTRVRHADLVWEVDEFGGHLAGLVMAEVELTDADQAIALPGWVGAEVSGDARFQNANLARAARIPTL
ncbi:CYTH domain-containing protein [Roseomonas hellenica]|uniref:CYTH domain-containing protein n=1 Tax=Plastoroseomonas hellenica TaxID=2687306 RepID=A0ABS5ERK4_9PROT|nr:CYTH domain-containing protein [Plastoroseomonas hellenica]MBR0662873.1 CYTH domain-containing protein [Plastoroseomonas hellenica]